LTFGQYTFGERPNAARDALEARALAYLHAESSRVPSDVARHLQLPLVDRVDSERWWTFAREVAGDLVRVYQEARAEIRDLYAGLKASTYLEDGFGEFFCWYDHVAYAHAIDSLAASGALVIPTSRFAAVIWQEASQATSF
jgi:hypothetical protein